DVLSALMFGARISLFVGGASVLLSLAVGVGLGLLSGYVGGRVDALIMRVCDVMLSFPSILIALLFAGVGHALFPNANDSLAFGVVIVAIALPGWVQYARAVRGSTMVERHKEYVQAARVIGVPAWRIMLRHVLPNVMGPVLVLSTIQVAVAIIAEATLSFLGVGVSPTSPSLGTFINEGNKQLFSGAWWLVVFPGATLVLIALSINLFGDWLRDALNPRLR
ncbi:MAG TPA: ABC transporter permease, partial [Caldimonas sp.]